MHEEEKPTWGERLDVWTDKVLDRVFTPRLEEKLNHLLDHGLRREKPQETPLDKAHDLLRSTHDRPIVRRGLGTTRAELSRRQPEHGRNGPVTPER